MDKKFSWCWHEALPEHPAYLDIRLCNDPNKHRTLQGAYAIYPVNKIKNHTPPTGHEIYQNLPKFCFSVIIFGRAVKT